MHAQRSRPPARLRRAALRLALLVGVVSSTGATCGSDDATPTFGITATVTGLLGTGLTLGNGADTLVVSATGPLTVTAAVPDGTHYDVVVVAQPTGPDQVCTVTNGSGTIDGADASDILIDCVTTAAPLTLVASAPPDGATAVARTVAPVLTFSAPIDATTATANVTLRSASGPTAIAVGAAGAAVTITPAQALAPLTAYTLTIGSGLRGSGGEALAAPVVTTFTTAGATSSWTTPTRVPPAATVDSFGPHVAFDAAGDGVLLWGQGNGSARAEWASSYQPATGWGPPVMVRAANTQDLHVAMNAAGAAVAIWVEQDATATNVDLWASHYTPATGWSAAAPVETAGGASDPKIAIDGAGNAIAVWRHMGPTALVVTVWANRYVAGTGWGTPVAIEPPEYATAPELTIDPAGNAFALWGDRDLGLVAARYTVGGGWTGPDRIENGAGASTGQLVLDGNGDATAVYLDNDGSRQNLMAVRYTAAAGWSAPVLIEHNDVGDAHIPQLGVDATGAVTAAWYQSDGAHSSAWATRYTVAAGWGTPVLLETDAGIATDLHLAVSANGDAAAVWKQYDGTDDRIWANHATATGWGTGQQVQVNLGANVSNLQIAIDGSGRALAVWDEYMASQYQVWGAWSQP